MDENLELARKRLLELAGRAAQRGVYTHSWFLSINELAMLASLKKELGHVPCTLHGGVPWAERQLAQFGSEELCGYLQPPPICCICIRPTSGKFQAEPSHRDYLGALMSLGIERATLGDILCTGGAAYLFCLETVAPHILQNLTHVKNSAVTCELAAAPPSDAAPKFERQAAQVASERADALVARAWRLSRGESELLFRQQRVFVNGALCTRPAMQPEPGDVISARGLGRFVYLGVTGKSKKGKLNVELDMFK